MAKVSLSKALNLKNKVVGQIENLKRLVQAHNSRVEDRKSNFDVDKLFSDYVKSIENLIAIKTAIAVANVSIYADIYKMSELKAKAAYLRSLPVREDKEIVERYSQTPVIRQWVCTFNDAQIEEKVKAIQEEIENIQDKINAFNATTMIEVPEL